MPETGDGKEREAGVSKVVEDEARNEEVGEDEVEYDDEVKSTLLEAARMIDDEVLGKW